MKVIKYTCFISGTALLIAALFLVMYNVHEDRRGGEQAESALTELRENIPETTEILTAENYDLYAEYETTVPEMEVTEIDGHSYIGYISIPALDIELPVMAEWSYPGLNIAPCRYTGSIYTDDLVIAAHNYSSHFGKINHLREDDEMVFTDVKGKKHRYKVCSIEQLPGTAVEDMKFGNSDEWDLTLFTCTLNGQSRITVRAEKI
ncbi:MAG: sortase [Ruminococcus sp.]|jgi:sortase A|nr:sortase [Ruminococcus sp.]